MPIKMPRDPDYTCNDCRYKFILSPLLVISMLLKRRKGVQCPKCKSKNIELLRY